KRPRAAPPQRPGRILPAAWPRFPQAPRRSISRSLSSTSTKTSGTAWPSLSSPGRSSSGRPSRCGGVAGGWRGLGTRGARAARAAYLARRRTGRPFGPDQGHTEPFGALDVTCALLELALVAGCAALLWRPSLADRPVRRRTGFAAIASMAVIPAGVIAATTAVMTPGWAGPEGPAGMAPHMTASSSAAAPGAQPGMGNTGTTDGLPDMRMYGSAAPATAAQIIAAGQLIKQTGATLARFRTVTTSHRSVT